MSDIYVFTVKCRAYGLIRVRHNNSFVRFRIDHVLLTWFCHHKYSYLIKISSFVALETAIRNVDIHASVVCRNLKCHNFILATGWWESI